MSAFAYAISNDETILLSDGLSIRDGKEVHSTTKRKVFRLNDNLAWAWFGNSPDGLTERITGFIDALPMKTPETVADVLSKVTAKCLKYDSVKYDTPIFTLVAGYDDAGTLKVFKIWSPDGPEPKREFMKPGQSGGIRAQGPGGFPLFSKILQEKKKPLPAFREAVDTLSALGVPVGGQLYRVIVKNPRTGPITE